MLLNVRRPLRSLMAASLLVIIGACDSNSPSNAAPSAQKSGQQSAQKSGATAPARDWTQTVTATPEGGFLMGNPDAPVKLMEYASLQCSHCATFHKEGAEALKRDYVAPGKVSYEVRTFILGPIDVPVTLAARCQGPQPFFRIAGDVFESQGAWMQKAMDNQSSFAALQGKPQVDQLMGILEITGMDDFYRARGLPSAKLRQCMQDQTQLDLLTRIRNDGTKANIPGTPAFFINGNLVQDTGTWEALEPKLKDALN